jgi:hypothetical protein
MPLAKTDASQRALWVAILGTATVAGSYIFACATPFAALAALAALYLPRRDGLILIAASWAANQAIGYCVLNYPTTADSFAWGGVIGLGALAALFAAHAAERVLVNPMLAAAVAFLAALAVNQIVLTAFTLVLPVGAGLDPAVFKYVAVVNLLAFLGLIALQGAGRMVGLAKPAHA